MKKLGTWWIPAVSRGRDGNTLSCPRPSGELRPWLRVLARARGLCTLDMRIPADGVWAPLDCDPFTDEDLQHYHAWSSSLHPCEGPLDMDVPETGAWVEAELDVIKMDITTAQQEATIATRQQRGPPSKRAILHRRAQLAARFKCTGPAASFFSGDVLVVVRPEDSPAFWAMIRAKEAGLLRALESAGASCCVFAKEKRWDADVLWAGQDAGKTKARAQRRRANLQQYFSRPSRRSLGRNDCGRDNRCPSESR